MREGARKGTRPTGGESPEPDPHNPGGILQHQTVPWWMENTIFFMKTYVEKLQMEKKNTKFRKAGGQEDGKMCSRRETQGLHRNFYCISKVRGTLL